MSDQPPASEPVEPSRAALDRLLAELRPRLHRYCARMTGSVIDGEDVVQDTVIKAIEAYGSAVPLLAPEAWLFRIAHNAALDFLRRKARLLAATEAEMEAIPDPSNDAEQRAVATASLRHFIGLPAAQRSCVILADVLGYSAEEVGAINAMTVAAVKAALHRGRARLLVVAAEPEDRPMPRLDEVERLRLADYIAHFNARDFAAIRDMLAEEVRLDLVNRLQLKGKTQVAPYFHRYDETSHWHLRPGLVEGRPAVLVSDPADPAHAPRYFMLLQWSGGQINGIRDFLFAPYAMESAEIVPLA